MISGVAWRRPVLHHEEALAVEVVGHREALAEGPDHPALVGLDGRLVPAGHHLGAREDEERAEEPDHPLELQERRAERDEDAARDERAQDPEEQHPVLVGRGDAEVGQHDHEDEDVVDRERVLDDVARQELERRLAGGEQRVEARRAHQPRVEREVPAHVEVEGQVEGERQGDPDDAPGGGLPDRDGVRAAMEDPEVERQQHEDERQEPEVEGPVVGEREERDGAGHSSFKRWSLSDKSRSRPATAPTATVGAGSRTRCGARRPTRFALTACRAGATLRPASRAAFPCLSRKGDLK